jgi:hypothetical protein
LPLLLTLDGAALVRIEIGPEATTVRAGFVSRSLGYDDNCAERGRAAAGLSGGCAGTQTRGSQDMVVEIWQRLAKVR